jgi:hypothetical protein
VRIETKKVTIFYLLPIFAVWTGLALTFDAVEVVQVMLQTDLHLRFLWNMPIGLMP